jgi:hypothetical protein
MTDYRDVEKYDGDRDHTPHGGGDRHLIPGLILAAGALLSLWLYVRYRIIFVFIFLPLGAFSFRLIGRFFRSRREE